MTMKWKKLQYPELSNAIIVRNGNSAKFFSQASNGKYFKELFTVTSNRIVVSGWYVSFTLVAQHVRLTD